MKRKIKLKKEDLKSLIEFLQGESKKYQDLYKLGIDIMELTEGYNKIIHTQAKEMWGEQFYEWITAFVYESPNGGWSNEDDCAICYSVDSMWEYFNGGDYKQKYEDDLKYYLNDSTETPPILIKAVNDKVFYTIAKTFIKDEHVDLLKFRFDEYTNKEDFDEYIDLSHHNNTDNFKIYDYNDYLKTLETIK